MKYLKKYNESIDSKIWEEIEDILSPISDDGLLSFKVQNFKFPTEKGSKSSILIRIRKDWKISGERFEYFNIGDIKDELNHLCNSFPDVINQIQIFREVAKNPVRYTAKEFILESPTGTTFLVSITLKVQKEGAPFIPPN